MNKITQEIVVKIAEEFPKHAKSHSTFFDTEVLYAYHEHLRSTLGYARKERAMRLWKLSHPEHFNGEGFLKSHEPKLYDLEIRISNIAARSVYRRIDKKTELQLDDYTDFLDTLTHPQPSLF